MKFLIDAQLPPLLADWIGGVRRSSVPTTTTVGTSMLVTASTMSTVLRTAPHIPRVRGAQSRTTRSQNATCAGVDRAPIVA